MRDECRLCDGTGDLELHARCHPTAPLRARLIDGTDGDVLVLSCYDPACNREVTRFKLEKEEATH